MLTLDRLTAQDLQILKLEAGAIRGHTCKVLILERSGERPLPTIAQLRNSIAARLDAAPRLRKRLVQTPLRVANPAWVDDPDFEIERHVVAVPADAGADGQTLRETVARLMTERLDRSRPLWRIDVMEGLEDGSMALIWRIHHSLADGSSCMQLASEALWSDQPGVAPTAFSGWSPEPCPGTLGLLGLGLRDRVLALGRREPAPHVPVSPDAVRRELGHDATLTPFAIAAGRGRRVAFASARLAELKSAGKAIDPAVTVNDVVLAAIAGGVRAMLRCTEASPERIRVKVPVSLHGDAHDHDHDVGNRDSYFCVDLPVHEADAAERVLAISRETQERKLRHDADLLYRLGRHPFVAHWATSPRAFTFNVSNVRGPSNRVYVGGAAVRELHSLAEIAQSHALRVAVVSMNGELFFGLLADRDAAADVDLLAESIERSCEEICALA